MELIQGKEEYFFDFLEKLNKKDKIAIITHTDLDGFASAIILKKILEFKKLKIKSLYFCDYGKGKLESIHTKLKSKKINKLFICDINIDSDFEGYKKIKEKIELIVIDHHPTEILDDRMIKTRSEDCATLTLYNLGKKIADLENLKKLICATMISEFSYKKEENLKFLQENYKELSEKNIMDSIPGELSKKISSTIIYFKREKKKVFNLILKENEKKLKKYYNIVDKEINRYVEKFLNEEILLDEDIHFYLTNPNPKFDITSIVATIISLKKPKETFIVGSEEKGIIKVSVRNQDGKRDVNLLMKKAIQGLENASGGGHVKAAAAKFFKKDLEKFKENLIS